MYNISIPNLLNGVSQQPATVRLPSQCSILENGYPSPTSSLSKRPNTEKIRNFAGPAVPHGKLHIIERGDGESYAVMLNQSGITVHDLVNDTAVPVVITTGALSYLSAGSPADFNTNITLTTIADTTFVCNRSVTVAATAGLPTWNYIRGLIWVKSSNYGIKHAVEIRLLNANGGQASGTTPLNASFVTADIQTAGDGYLAVAESVDGEMFLAGTSVLDGAYIAARLATAIKTVRTQKIAAGESAWNNLILTRQGYAIDVFLNVYGSNPPAVDFDLLHQDGVPQSTGLEFVKDEVQSFEQLPVLCKEGMLVKVAGMPEDPVDDYYVKFKGSSPGTTTAMSEGQWVESRPNGILTRLTANTMPHVLIRTFSGGNPVFTFTPADGSTSAAGLKWAEREVGDDVTNPPPSFVGSSITSIFGFKNRLGILAGEAVIMSEAGDHFNFWRTTVASLLDTDPIDVYSSHSQITEFRYGVPLDDKLVLFADNAQLVLDSADQPLTPKTVSLVPLGQYNCTSDCMPAAAGSEVFFGFDRSNFTGIRDMIVNLQDSRMVVAPEITAHVPSYLFGRPAEIKASELEKCLIVRTADVPSSLYLYKWMNASDERVQSSWSVWSFSNIDILSIGWLDSVLYMLVYDQLNLKYGLRMLDVREGRTDVDSPIASLLDDRVTVAENSVSSGTFTVPGRVAWTDITSFSNDPPPPGELVYTHGPALFTNTDPEMASGSFVVNPGSTALVHNAAITGTYTATHASGDYNTRELTVFPVILGSNCSLGVTVTSSPTASTNIFTPTSWPSLANNSLICEIVVDGSTMFYEELLNSPDFSVTTTAVTGVRNVEGQASFNYGSDSYVVACNLNFNDGTTALASDVITGNMLLSSGTNQANRTVVLKLIRKRVMNADGTILQGSGTPLFSFASSYVNAGENPVNIAGGSLIPLVDLVYADGVLAGQSIPFDLSYDPVWDQSTFSFDPAIGSPKMFYGTPYRFFYRFSPPYLRTGTERTALTSGRWQIRNLQLIYDASGPFLAEISPVNASLGPSYSYPRSSIVSTSFLGSSLESGTMRVPVMAKPDQVHIDLVNDTPFPSHIVSAEIEATYDGRFRRI